MFKQDKHTAKLLLEWKQANIILSEWPCHSPDLNPIKTL